MDPPFAKLVAVGYSIASSQQRDVYSAASIDRSMIDASVPEDGSLYDTRMGVNNDSMECRTCQHFHKLCPKHFGAINLAVPMINPHTIIFTELLRWLVVKCPFCGSFMSDPRAAPGPAKTRLRTCADALKILRPSDKTLNDVDPTKVPRCPSCTRPHPLLLVRPLKKRCQIFAFVPERASNGSFRLDQEVPLTPVLVQKWLYKVTPDDVRSMGHDPATYHPRNFIKTLIEVPPVNLRSGQVAVGSAKPRMDALTQYMASIINANREIEPNKDLFKESLAAVLAPAPSIETLQAHAALSSDRGRLDSVNVIGNIYNQYLTGKATGTHGGPRHIAPEEGSLAQILHSKRGLIRQDGLGSRNHNRGRMVIYNCPHLPIDCVLLPLFALMRLRRRTIVTHRNYAAMRRYLLNGPNVYPGAFNVTRGDGTMFSVEKITHPETFDLRLGDSVEHMILENEWIVINRQPSTLLTNICAHRVRVDPNPNSFAMGLNNEVCGLYNADFDGDQMTILALKEMASNVESGILTNVRNHFMNDQRSVPNWGLSQDGRTMIAELSRSHVRLSRSEAIMICEHVTKAIVFDSDFYSGRDVISLVLPKINYRRVSAWGADPVAVATLGIPADEREVVIKDGKVISGVFDTQTVAPSKGSIFDAIYAVYGIDEAMAAIYNLQQIALAYSRIGIFTISPRDFIITEAVTRESIHGEVSKTLLDADLIVQSFQNGLMTASADRTLGEHFEAKMVNELQTVQPKELIYKALSGGAGDTPTRQPNKTSSLLRMVLYGSRGKPTNLMAITGCIGQTLIDGKRIRRNFDYKRATIYHQRGDLAPESCGFVPDPYYVGLSPPAYFTSAQESLATIIRKALSTADAGAMCRQMVRNTESMMVSHWHGVMCNTRVVEWVFGDNNFDPGKVFEYEIPGIKDSDAAFEAAFNMPKTELSDDPIVKRLAAQRRADRAAYRRNCAIIQGSSGVPYSPTQQRFPLDILMHAQIMIDRYGAATVPKADLLGRLKRVEDLCAWYPGSSFNGNVSASSLPIHYANSYSFMQMYTRATLEPKLLSTMGDEAFDALMQLIQTAFLDALIEPGEAIGIKSATATSQPVTQNQLDSTHGVGKESSVVYTLQDTNNHIFAKSIEKTPFAKMWMRVRPDLEEDQAAVDRIAATIQTVVLGEFMEQLQIFYEGFGHIEHPDFAPEKAIYEQFLKSNQYRPAFKSGGDGISKYVVRIQLDRRKMLGKNIGIVDIVKRLYELHDDIFVVHNFMNDMKFPLVLRVHLLQRELKRLAKNNVMAKVIEYAHGLLKTPVRGVEGILEAFSAPMRITEVDDNDAIPTKGALRARTIYIIRTKGSNMLGLAGVPDIVPESVETNSMHETFRVLGMPCARAKISQEWCKILTDFVPSYFIFLTDIMLSTARITPLNRSGNLLREPTNVLLNMGTAMAMSVVLKASLNEAVNHLYGLSGPLLTGQTMGHGTGSVEVAYDPVFLRKQGAAPSALLEAL